MVLIGCPLTINERRPATGAVGFVLRRFIGIEYSVSPCIAAFALTLGRLVPTIAGLYLRAHMVFGHITPAT